MLDYPDTIKAAFIHRHGDGGNISSAQRMNIRHELAKALLAKQYSHLSAKLNKKVIDQHNEAVGEWNLILDGVSFAEDIPQYVFFFFPFSISLTRVHMCRARDTLFDAVHPLLQAIGSYANCYVSLVAGNSGTDETDEGFFTA